MTARTSPAAAEFFPSIAAGAFGRVLGALMECVPLRLGRVKLSYLLFGPVVAGLSIPAYALQKLLGKRYVLTGDAIQQWPMIGSDAKAAVRLQDVADATVRVRTGQAFFDAGDVVLTGKAGDELLVLEGMSRPNRVRSSILDVRDSAHQATAVEETVRRRTASA